MKKIRIVLIITFLQVFCITLVAQENPFLRMNGKKTLDESPELYYKCLTFFSPDTTDTQKIIHQLNEVAEKTGSLKWQLYVEYFELVLFVEKIQLDKKNKYPAEEIYQRANNLLIKAQKVDVPHLELKVRSDIIESCWLYLKQYELAFELCAIQDERLQKMSSDDIPEKASHYVQIANSYYTFKDYLKAILYFNKILDEKTNAHNELPKQSALNGLGLSYRGFNDLDRSDSCFYAIMQTNYLDPKNEWHRDEWLGIAEGNIGYNMLLRGKYEQAIPLLKSSIDKMLKYNDYGYASGIAINLADIYLKKGNAVQAKQYIDLAIDYQFKMPRDGRLVRIYEVMSKYYASIGNAKLSMAYMDSTILDNKRLEEQFNALQMMRVEQRKHLSEQKLKDEQLNAQKIKTIGYLRSFIIAIVGLLLLGGMLAFYFVLYKKKKAAFRELVRKSQEWAHVEPQRHEPSRDMEPDELAEPVEQEIENEAPDEVDCLIMKDIEHIMVEKKLYRDTALSLDLLAQKLGAKRHYISNAINNCMKKSFNTFINEYRVKEAIQLLSKSDAGTFTIDYIAFDSGFNDRQNFYRVFKKMTGLSPAEFRRNVEKI